MNEYRKRKEAKKEERSGKSLSHPCGL